jgi:predicted ATPase
VIASRIDRLSKEDKALLQLASVLGPRISPNLLAAVTEMPIAQLQSRLWSLEILDFLEEVRSVPSVEYVFAHDSRGCLRINPSLAAGSAASPDFDGSGSKLDRA